MTAGWHLHDRRGNSRSDRPQRLTGEHLQAGEGTGFSSHRGDRAITHE